MSEDTNQPEVPTSAAQEAADSVKATAPTPATPEAEKPQESYLETVKKNLEFAVAGKSATVRLHGQIIEFSRWGLQKRMSLGTRVISLVQKAQAFIPSDSEESLYSADTITLLMQALSYMTDDVLEIIARSITSPWKNPNEAVAWMDQNCELEDLFDLCIIVYEMNLKGEMLGKLQASANKLGSRMTSLLNPSSKS